MTRILLFLALAACGRADANPQHEQAPSGPAPVEHRLTTSSGLTATIFATIPGARAIVIGPDSAIYISQPASGQITRLMDAHHTGVAESKTVVIRGLNRPHGMAFHNAYLYVANTDGVVRMKLNTHGMAIGAPEQLNHYSEDGMHWTRSIVFGADNMMYVSIGSPCNVCTGHPDRALVMQYDENGKNGHVFAKGLRNAVGLAINPVTRALWASVNERDNISPDHENLPPDALDILQAGGDYGWPYCYNGDHPNPEFNNVARCANVISDALPLQAHSAPLGMTFLANATQLLPDQRGDLLIAYHGSWDRDIPTGAKVVRVHIEHNRPTKVEDFVTGWQRHDGSRWGRPVDLAVATDGAVLITDDGSGEIIRLARP